MILGNNLWLYLLTSIYCHQKEMSTFSNEPFYKVQQSKNMVT